MKFSESNNRENPLNLGGVHSLVCPSIRPSSYRLVDEAGNKTPENGPCHIVEVARHNWERPWDKMIRYTKIGAFFEGHSIEHRWCDGATTPFENMSMSKPYRLILSDTFFFSLPICFSHHLCSIAWHLSIPLTADISWRRCMHARDTEVGKRSQTFKWIDVVKSLHHENIFSHCRTVIVQDVFKFKSMGF